VETIIIIVVLVLLYFVYGSSKDKSNGRSNSNKKSNDYKIFSDKDIQAEAEAIVEKITTPAGVTRLEERVEKASERVDELEDGSPSSYNKAVQKLHILEMAFGLAEDKPLKYVFIPDSDPFESKAVLKEGYKVIGLDKKQELESNFSGKGYFEEIRYYEMEDENPVEAVSNQEEIEANAALIKLRTIVEGKAKHATKIKNINKWVEENESESYWDTIDWWYDANELEEGITPGDAFYIAELIQMDCPTGEELYLQGYKEPQDYLSLDLEEFIKRDGVGEKTTERMRKFQEKIRSQLEAEQKQISE
jgi:hypothetical protein